MERLKMAMTSYASEVSPEWQRWAEDQMVYAALQYKLLEYGIVLPDDDEDDEDAEE